MANGDIDTNASSMNQSLNRMLGQGGTLFDEAMQPFKGKLASVNDEASGWLAKNSYVADKNDAKQAMPWVGGAAAGLISLLLIDPLTALGNGIAKAAKFVVTGGGAFENIPVIGGLFTGLGKAIDWRGDVSGVIFSGVIGLVTFEALQSKPEKPDMSNDSASTKTAEATATAGALALAPAFIKLPGTIEPAEARLTNGLLNAALGGEAITNSQRKAFVDLMGEGKLAEMEKLGLSKEEMAAVLQYLQDQKDIVIKEERGPLLSRLSSDPLKGVVVDKVSGGKYGPHAKDIRKSWKEQADEAWQAAQSRVTDVRTAREHLNEWYQWADGKKPGDPAPAEVKAWAEKLRANPELEKSILAEHADALGSVEGKLPIDTLNNLIKDQFSSAKSATVAEAAPGWFAENCPTFTKYGTQATEWAEGLPGAGKVIGAGEEVIAFGSKVAAPVVAFGGKALSVAAKVPVLGPATVGVGEWTLKKLPYLGAILSGYSDVSQANKLREEGKTGHAYMEDAMIPVDAAEMLGAKIPVAGKFIIPAAELVHTGLYDVDTLWTGQENMTPGIMATAVKQVPGVQWTGDKVGAGLADIDNAFHGRTDWQLAKQEAKNQQTRKDTAAQAWDTFTPEEQARIQKTMQDKKVDMLDAMVQEVKFEVKEGHGSRVPQQTPHVETASIPGQRPVTK